MRRGIPARRGVWVALLLSLALIAAACGGAGGSATTTAGVTTTTAAQGTATTAAADNQVSQKDLEFDLIFHDKDASGTFWGVMKNGLDDACAAQGVSCTMIGDPDITKQVALVDTSIANDVDGIILTLPNVDALRDAIQRAADAGIPVVTINSGSDVFATTAAIAHVGQDEFIAGQGAGKRLAANGATNILCVIHEANNAALQARCDGVEAGAGDVTVKRIQIDVANLDAAFETIKTAVSDSSIDAVITLNPDVSIRARDAIAEAGSTATLATFDLGEEVLNSIEAGTIQFAVDQQQYLQGFLPVVQLVLYLQSGLVIGGGQAILTGPGFVDASNVAQVKAGVAAGTR
ncbi:MAG: sugar ABC transporter substrate-binding protein [Actinobacteria bacterium]|nr:sugar ABC transporter substrate-binding protein [Actinomycetota bacterium]